MTNATFLTNHEGSLIGFVIQGHSGYSIHGYDIVCSAISTMAQAAIFGITEIAKIKATSSIDPKEVKMSIVVTDREPVNFDKAEFMLKTAYSLIEGVQDQYPDYVNLSLEQSEVL